MPDEQGRARGPKAAANGSTRAPASSPGDSFSLSADQPLAHRYRQGRLWIDGRSLAIGKYLRFNLASNPWLLSAVSDSARTTRLTRRRGRLSLPLEATELGPGASVVIRARAPRPLTLHLLVNGARTSELTVTESLSDLVFATGALRAGDNDIELVTSGSGELEIAWLSAGAGSASPGAPPPSGSDLSPGDRTVFFLVLPAGATVTGDPTAAIGPSVSVAASGRANQSTRLSKGASLDLSSLAGRAVRIELSAPGAEPVSVASVTLSGPAAGVAPSATHAPGPRPRYIILWIMDSLRADRVAAFVPSAKPESPNLTALAARSAVFVNAYVQGNESRVSHASLWSSLYPASHGLMAKKARLSDRAPALDRLLVKAGYLATGVTANGYVDPRWGLARHLSPFHNHIHEDGDLGGDAVLRRALRAVAGERRPWFLYIGTIDTHVPWTPKQPWFDRYAPPDRKSRFARAFTGRHADRAAAGRLHLRPDEIEIVRAIYDSNVSYQDALLGQLLSTLAEWGIADETLLVITADHGDELWEDGRQGHGRGLRESLIRVPLLLHYPAAIAPSRVETPVEIVDLLPTIAALVGATADPAWQGESLLPRPRGHAGGLPPLAMATDYGQHIAGRIGRFKLVDGPATAATLFDLIDDPGETRDLAGQAPIAVRAVADSLWMMAAHQTEWKKWLGGVAAPPASPASPSAH